MLKRDLHVLLIASAYLLIFVLLFFFRSADDNRLFSWAWMFAKVDAYRIYLLLVVGLIASFFLSHASIPERHQAPVLAALSFAAAVPFWSAPEIIVDASRYFTQAKHLELYGVGAFLTDWGKTLFAWTDLPLLPFLYGVVFTLFGESRLAIQLFTTALFSLTTVLTYLIGTKLWDRDLGFSAGLLLLGIPYLLTQVPLMLVDVPTMFFLSLAVYAFLEALNRGGAARIVFSAAAIVFAVLSKYSAWPMLSVLGVILIVYRIRQAEPKDGRLLLRGLTILLVAALASAALLLLKSDVLSDQLRLLLEYQKPGLERWGESYISTFLFQMHPVVAISAIASLAVAVRNRDARFAIISWLILLVVLFGVRRIRYTLPLFPLLALMAGYGLQAIRSREMRRFIVFSAVATSLIIALSAYLPFARGMSAENLRRAGAYLNTLDAAEIEVLTLAPKHRVVNPAVSVPLLDLSTNKRLRYDYRPEGFPAGEEIARSSLRFTWEYQNPPYYSAATAPGRDTPVVVLSDASDVPLPKHILRRLEGYRLSRTFFVNDGIFRYTVGVRVYQK